MKALFTGLVLVGLALLGWQVAIVLSPDAIAMAVGMLFGVLACIPVALLLMASQRRRASDDDEETSPTPVWEAYADDDDAAIIHVIDTPRRTIALPLLPDTQHMRRVAAAGKVTKRIPGAPIPAGKQIVKVRS